jgi:TonB family protein
LLVAAASTGGVGWWLYAGQSKRPASVFVPASFQPTVENTRPAPGQAPQGMVWIPGGEFSMGAAELPGMNMVGMEATTDSRPIHRVYVNGFWMDTTVVTNAQFAKFVEATGYVTVAERPLRPEDYPDALQENGTQGTVMVQLSVDRSGRMRESTLAQTSGSPMLDQAALRAVERVFPRSSAAPRECNLGTGFLVTLPLRFGLRDVPRNR